MAREEAAHLRAVLLVEHRAGDVGDAAAGLEQRHGAVEHLGLLLDAAARARPAACAIWRPGCAARHRCRCRARRSAPDRMRPARSSISPPTDFGVRTCTLRAPERVSRSWIGASRRLSSSVAKIWPLFSIIAASAKVLPPAPAQRSTTCSPGLAPRKQRRQLRALVLHFDHSPLRNAGSA